MESIITLDSRNSDKPRCIALHFGRKKKGGQSLFSKLLENGVQGKMRDDERERESINHLGGGRSTLVTSGSFAYFVLFTKSLILFFLYTAPENPVFVFR